MHDEDAAVELAIRVAKWAVAILLLLIAALMVGCPHYNVYKRELNGKAALQEATWNRRIAIEEARAKLESDSMLALAEVIRARGLAASADTVIASLGSPEAYLRYLWINNIDAQSGERIYIPTEAGLPILEARGKAVIPPPSE